MADRNVLGKPFDDPALELQRLQVIALGRIGGQLAGIHDTLKDIKARISDSEDDYGVGHWAQRTAANLDELIRRTP